MEFNICVVLLSFRYCLFCSGQREFLREVIHKGRIPCCLNPPSRFLHQQDPDWLKKSTNKFIHILSERWESCENSRESHKQKETSAYSRVLSRPTSLAIIAIACEQALCLGKKIAKNSSALDQRPVHRL